MVAKDIQVMPDSFATFRIKINMNKFLFFFVVVLVNFLPSIAMTGGNPILPTAPPYGCASMWFLNRSLR